MIGKIPSYEKHKQTNKQISIKNTTHCLENYK